ncbi:MAG: DUF2225 domain-containing protein [Treponemataceae bacterium]|nr:MAG: DUF2225 domain-containing protein [Treponemataceae bacterium]
MALIRSKPKDDEKKQLSISYYTKDKITCPVCKSTIKREEMLTGGGRMIAGPLTDELRRVYEPSAKYGKIYPSIYGAGACPMCSTAFFWNDFKIVANKAATAQFFKTEIQRKAAVEAVFPHYDLDRNRTLLDGAAIYYLALLSYDLLDANFSPTIKKAMCALRLAWLCGDMNELCPGFNYDFISKTFYQKAAFLYGEALEYETNQAENIANAGNLGPDIDKNYGYDGVIYLCGLLEYKYGQQEDMELRLKKLDNSKRAIARLFGLGKMSKTKPGPLLEHARVLYENIGKTLHEANMPDIDDD